MDNRTLRCGKKSNQVLTERRIFTGEEEHAIALVDAGRLTHNYRASMGMTCVKGGYTGRESLEMILSQHRAVGIRVYFARQLDGRPTLVLCGVDPIGNDIFEGFLSEDLWLCPPWCSRPNSLNSDSGATSHVTGYSRVLTGHESHYVTLAEASRLTRAFRNAVAVGEPKGGYFSRRIFYNILGQQSCVGIRLYFGKQDDGTPTLVLVGVAKTGDDMILGVIGEDVWLCPPWCADCNPLNS